MGGRRCWIALLAVVCLMAAVAMTLALADRHGDGGVKRADPPATMISHTESSVRPSPVGATSMRLLGVGVSTVLGVFLLARRRPAGRRPRSRRPRLQRGVVAWRAPP